MFRGRAGRRSGSIFPTLVGLLRLHFPSSFISEMKERHTSRESEEHPETATSLHLKAGRQREVGNRGQKGRVATPTGTQPQLPPRYPRAPLRSTSRHAHSFQMSYFL